MMSINIIITTLSDNSFFSVFIITSSIYFHHRHRLRHRHGHHQHQNYYMYIRLTVIFMHTRHYFI